jgi:hypothetical protein
MQINYHVTGADRKRLVKTIVSYTGCDAKYLGVPSCAYLVDGFTIDREGALSFDDSTDSEMVWELLDLLRKEGFEAEPGELTISVPVEFDRSQTYEKVTALISSKQTLIRQALGIEAMPVEQTDKGFDFPWFTTDATLAEQIAYKQFVTALVKTAAGLKRVNPTERKVENGKYEFRCFLLRLGFIGNEFKQSRKILLSNFEGSSAYKNAEEAE